jgi:hypothetical protein
MLCNGFFTVLADAPPCTGCILSSSPATTKAPLCQDAVRQFAVLPTLQNAQWESFGSTLTVYTCSWSPEELQECFAAAPFPHIIPKTMNATSLLKSHGGFNNAHLRWWMQQWTIPQQVSDVLRLAVAAEYEATYIDWDMLLFLIHSDLSIFQKQPVVAVLI